MIATTGGFAVTLAGRRASEWPISLDRAAGWLEPLVPREGQDASQRFILHALQIGLVAFTPDELNVAARIANDRPYASLLFAANTRTYIDGPSAPVYETSFTLGVLGLDVAKSIQRRIHEGLGLHEVPEGWDHQVSEGGEPTLRFTWARQALIASNFQSRVREFELKWRTEASVGYLTEASIGASARWGRINTPWWSFTPERADYVAQPAPVIGTSVGGSARERYAWAGIKVRRRLYNAFLQGQFRDSAVEFSSQAIEPLVVEAWLGMTWQISRVFRLSYVVRYQSDARRVVAAIPGTDRSHQPDIPWIGVRIRLHRLERSAGIFPPPRATKRDQQI